MSVLVLIALLATAFTIQYKLDVRGIVAEAAHRGWSVTGVSWAPLGGNWFGRSRNVRSYDLRYRDESGRFERCLCLVDGQTFTGSFDVAFEQVGRSKIATSSAWIAEKTASNRLVGILVWAFLGAWAGAALGIGVSFLIYPTSNVAPAYGVIFGTPLGLIAGVLFGALRRRRGV
jgi:hypothetical protein